MEMNDKAKAAIEWLRKLRDDARSVWESNHPTRKQRFLDVSPDDAEALVAHIDGEPLRQAKALEAVREELTRALRELELETARAEKADLDYRGVVENFDLDSLNKAINDARARVAELEAQLGGMTEQWKAELNHANAWMRKYQAAKAQMAAARKFIEDDTCRHDEEKRAVLRAMDEAAK